MGVKPHNTYAYPFEALKQAVATHPLYHQSGRVVKVVGLTLEVEGITGAIGDLCLIYPEGAPLATKAEIIGFVEQRVLLMILGHLDGIGPGAKVVPTGEGFQIKVSDALLGQVLDGLGNPIEQPPIEGEERKIMANPVPAMKRQRIKRPLRTGIRAIDGLLTIGEGQRMGIFAGSGVGKSTLLGMISQHNEADVTIVCLIGERNREVREFLEESLNPNQLDKTIMVFATSDEPPLVRIKSAYVATTIAEYFRDQGLKVVLLMDSVTRFAMAQREIGLAVGELPTSKGYTPSVFALLPRLLERTGTGETGTITAFYTVLVDGDDLTEPIADAVRGILDGHIVLSRKIAEQHQFPAIDVLASISRLMPQLITEPHKMIASRVRQTLALYQKNEDFISIGAYETGSNPELDQAIKHQQAILEVLKQETTDCVLFEDTLQAFNESVSTV